MHAAEPHVWPIIRPSLRGGFNGVLRALPGDRAFLPPSPRGPVACRTRSGRQASAQLDASIGASGPHDFSVRGGLPQKPLDELGTGLAEAFAKAVQRRSSARRGVAHGFSSAPCDPRSRARRCRVHRIPRSTSVTIAIRPLMRRDNRIHKSDFSKSRSDLFFREGMDRFLRRLPVGQISDVRARCRIGGFSPRCRCGQKLRTSSLAGESPCFLIG
jgi:hypothetical protein